MRINTKIKDRGKILPEKLEAILWSKNIKAIDPDEDKVKENLCKTCFLFAKNYLLRTNKELDEKYYVRSFS